MVKEEEGQSGRREEGHSQLMREVEATGAELRRSLEELQRSQSEVWKLDQHRIRIWVGVLVNLHVCVCVCAGPEVLP